MKKDLVYLVQTDTTVGFSSSDNEKLSVIKKRPVTQKILQTVNSFETLKENSRIPNKFKKRVRNSKLSTYIYPNGNSYRVIDKNSLFYDFIDKFGTLYSSSANETKKEFDEEFAINSSNVIVFSKYGFFEDRPSNLYKINKIKIQKIR